MQIYIITIYNIAIYSVFCCFMQVLLARSEKKVKQNNTVIIIIS